ncbi:Uma2 family endonuclease [Trichocoleus sp. FACHB-591]|uniref:Uma2 family endonuclease n=1 Tax=Trichocoleus sp. FACHB-591 TaxID=2692872 RepID=UPI0016866FF7|nr:Uma2 family endonuclease [Trichocoleus sp. FACHB-591]
MAQTLSKSINLEEFLKLPETKPASEYIDGKIIQKPMPQGKHSTIQTEFSTTVNAVLKSRRIARAFSELRLTFGDRSTVPDVSVFTWEKIPRDENGEIANTFAIAPDWTIEILSPDQSQTKVTKNILHCLNHGTQMGWLIDPDEQTVFVYLPKQQPEVFDASEQKLPVPSFASELNLNVGAVFGWLLE